jgi:hypothetical protein
LGVNFTPIDSNRFANDLLNKKNRTKHNPIKIAGTIYNTSDELILLSRTNNPKNAMLDNATKPINLSSKTVEIASQFLPEDLVTSYTRIISPPIKLNKKLLKNKPVK